MSEVARNLLSGTIFLSVGVLILQNLEAIARFDQSTGVKLHSWFKKTGGFGLKPRNLFGRHSERITKIENWTTRRRRVLHSCGSAVYKPGFGTLFSFIHCLSAAPHFSDPAARIWQDKPAGWVQHSRDFAQIFFLVIFFGEYLGGLRESNG